MIQEKGLVTLRLETSVVIISFIMAVILGIIIIPILKKLKVGQIERDDGPKSHLKKQGTPTMGGIIMIITMIIIMTGVYIYFTFNEQIDVANRLLPILILTIGFGLIGFIDDFKKLVLKNTEGLKPSYKMFGLLIISVIYVLYLTQGLHLGTQTYIPILKTYIEIPIYLYIPFTIFVLLGTTNAINLTDGIDGLSSSVSSIIITCLTVIGILWGVPEVSIFGSVVIGAVLGFLMFNLHPAKVFMGDTGSLLLGGVISALALYLISMTARHSVTASPQYRTSFFISILAITISGILPVPLNLSSVNSVKIRRSHSSQSQPIRLRR